MIKSRTPSSRAGATKKGPKRTAQNKPRRSGRRAEAQGAPEDDGQIAARMVAVLADPAMLGSSTSDKIRKSGVSKADWYRCHNDGRFLRKMALACAEALDDSTGSVLEALAESARVPGRSGPVDRKLFLELVGHNKSAARLREEEK